MIQCVRSSWLRRGPDLRVAILIGAACAALNCGAAAPRASDELRPFGPASGEWRQIFNEDFTYSIDPARWTTCYWWNNGGCTNLSTGELQWYLPSNAMVTNGNLCLQAREEAVKGIEGRTFFYTSGILTSGADYEEKPRSARLAFKYGYVEIRAKVPKGKGLWPALWMLPTTWQALPEIDIMEVLGNATNILELHYHFLKKDGGAGHEGRQVAVKDLSAGWHVYGLDWRAGTLVWYLDGKEVWRVTNADEVPSQELYLLMNLAVGGDWPGTPNQTTVFPQCFLIDYVRVWQLQPS